ncbi:MAG TPA: leucine--tRNA ligase [Firmicutes bacterium]|nr:leucine--tRNA ligase [Candidatus Fermentithermobacillaceae bacterium]
MAVSDYNPAEIEKKWQDIWEKEGVFRASRDHSKPKYYVLIEFPYPSGEGLHVGHPRSNTAMDIIARKRRMQGYNVLFPIGWDAFGLPTENYAMKHKIHPRIVTEKNIARFKQQLKSLGFSFDWSREINTTDPNYYRWTQWIFLKFFEKGLAYKAEMPINFCTQCKVGLANEEVVNGRCERCGGEVIRKVKSQWMLRITEYAQKLLDDLELVDYIEKVKIQQRNWIGRSEGAEIDFPIPNSNKKIRVFSTRPDTLFGATYMVLSPEHPFVDEFKDRIANWDDVEAYRAEAMKKSDFERTEIAREKTGVPLKGFTAINPATGKEIPVWISDYVLMSYGTGAIMGVPGHDARDWEFAKKFNLPIVEVVKGGDVEKEAYTDTESGILVNSGFLNGLTVKEAIEKMILWLEEKGIGKRTVNYKLRDWVFSRQRYWGEPIPLVHCEKCGWVPVPEEELPVILPPLEDYVPTETGESPLAKVTDWVNTTCPRCGGPARRETDTMPQWAGSSWYFLRYTDPHNDREFASMEELKYWLPVDWYNGGMEHTTLHLLYSRFWHKFLYDLGYVPTPEPYKKRTSHGMILGENGEKMSKSRGNVINPDDIVREFGADTFRVYEMFIGAFDQAIPWSQQGVKGCRRFLEKVWKLQDILVGDGPSPEGYSPEFETAMHRTVKKVSLDYERMKFNTAVAAMMSLVNDFHDAGRITRGELRTLLLILNPVAPHITEEMWERVGFEGHIYQQSWPTWDESKTVEDVVEIAVQVNGKLRGLVTVPRSAPQDEVKEAVLEQESVRRYLDGKQVVKEVYVPGRIYSIVVK